MRVLLFVEGVMEQKALPHCLRAYTSRVLGVNIGFQAICLNGAPNYLKDIADSVQRTFRTKSSSDIIAAIGLVDLYGLPMPDAGWPTRPVGERVTTAKRHIETMVSHAKFSQFFAVHETEAWLIADAARLPPEVRRGVPGSKPEEINSDQPPSKRLDRLYRDKLSKPYRKATDGVNMLRTLTHDVVAEKCPHFRDLLDTITTLVKPGAPA